MISEQRSFIEHAKRMEQTSQLNKLILRDDSIESSNSKDIIELLVSQFASALTDPCLANMSFESFSSSKKLPIPMVFAIFKKQLSSGLLNEALSLFTAHIDRKSLEKVYILIYNVTKISESLGDYSKVTFYLETLLREEPFFLPAVFDLALIYAQRLERVSQAFDLLQRHLVSIKTSNFLVNSAFIYCCHLLGTDIKQKIRVLHNKELSLTSYFNLGLLFRKKGQLDLAYRIFQQLTRKLEVYLNSSVEQVNPKDLKLFLLSYFNMIKIRREEGNYMEASLLAEMMLEIESQFLDFEAQTWLKNVKKEKYDRPSFKQIENRKTLFRTNKIFNRKDNSQAFVDNIGKKTKGVNNFLEESQQRNTLKLRHLLTKQKNIDRFFKNIYIKCQKVSQKVEVGLKNSYQYARQELLGSSKVSDITKNVLEEQFEEKRKRYALEFESDNIQDAILYILNNLSNLKQVYKGINHPRGIAKEIKLLKSIKVPQKPSRVSHQALQSSHSRFRLKASQQNKLSSERSVNKINFSNFKPPKLNISVGKIKKALSPPKTKKIQETLLKEDFQSISNEKKVKKTEENNMTEKQQKKIKNQQTTSEKGSLERENSSEEHEQENIETKVKNVKWQKEKQLKTCKSQSYKQIQSIEVETEPLKKATQSNFIKKESVDKAKISFDPLASSFNLTNFSSHQFRKLGAKRFGQNQTSATLWKSDKINEVPKVLSSEFHQQMQKVTELQKKEDWQGAYQKLLELYKVFKKEDQKNQILLRIGNIFEKQQKYLEAEKTYLKCSKFNSADAFLSLGSLQLKTGKIEQGVQNLEKANCLRRFDITIENKLVYGYSLRQETMDKALKLAHNILKKEPNSLETLLITAGILEKQGLVEEAIQIVKAIDQVRQTEHIKHYLGILYLSASNLKEAFSCFRQALVLKPDYVPSLIETASIISQNHPKQAITIFNKILQLSPGNRKALARLGKIYEAEQDFQNAMSTYKAALGTQQNYESYIKIGDCLAKKESYIEALLNYKEALNLKKSPQAYSKLAYMFELKKDFTKAIQNYQSALSLIESHDLRRRSYLLAIGRLHLKMGQYETSISSLQQILQGTESVELFKLLGQAYFGNKQYAQSLSFFEKANEISENSDLQILESMAMCLDRMEEFLASKAIYEKILQRNPNNIRCLNNLGNIQLITGQTNEAFFLFETLLEKCPKNIEKRLKLADIYAEVGDWSKVEYHLVQCNKQKENDPRIIEKLVVLFKEKRDNKMAAKYEKKLALLKAATKNKLGN